MKNFYRLAGASLLVILLAAGCGQPSADEPQSEPDGSSAESPVPDQEEGIDGTAVPTTEPAGEPANEETPPGRPTRELPDSIQTVPPPDAQPVITGEVPQNILDEMTADLASRLNVSQGEISVTTAQSVVWNDGSLGCPQPGMFYTQALVDGYFVILTAGDESYNYHASQKGYFLLCENAAPSAPSDLGTPTS